MSQVSTTLGSVDTSSLGFTLSHEHVAVSSAGFPVTYPDFYDRKATIERAVRDLSAAYREGVRTIVDVTTPDLGRDVHLIEEVSRRSGVHIVAATGTWVDIPRAFAAVDADRIARLYIREIEQGMDGTSIKAGVIKVANNNPELAPQEVTVLRAAARASIRTGTPISTHTRSTEMVGESQVAIFQEEGVDLRKVCIGHSNDTTDLDYLLRLLGTGVYLGMDHYPGGRAGPPDWKERTAIVKRLIDAGYGHRIMLSHDWNSNVDWDESTQEQRHRFNSDGYLFLTRHVLPELSRLGASDAAIKALVVDNPRRFFEGT